MKEEQEPKQEFSALGDKRGFVEELLDKKLRKEQEKQEKPVSSWHPSKIGTCLTGMFLERMGVKPDRGFDERRLRLFSAGKQFENWIGDLIAETGKVERQVRIEWPEMDVNGYADLVLETDEGKIVYEIKTKHSGAFWYMTKEGRPNRQHEMQLWLYLYRLGIQEGRLCYISKDDLAIQEYRVVRGDDELGYETIQELNVLNLAWKEKLPPPVPELLPAWKATYCRWHKQCVTQPKYLYT